MSNFPTENLRTIALVGHGASGKTSLIEAMLAPGNLCVVGSEASIGKHRDLLKTVEPLVR